MDRSLCRYILKHSAKRQLVLLALVLVSMPIIYLSLELPKLIVNRAIEGQDIPATLFGVEMDQIRYLLVLCLAFLIAVMVAGLVKYVINVVRGVLGEQVLRHFRASLYQQVLRFPLPSFKRVSQGEIIPMITSETEPLGEFIGDSFSLPIQQCGLLFTYLVFIFIQNVWMGLAAIALYPFQMWFIPRLQKVVNLLAKQRVRKMRELSAEVGETVAGIGEIHGNDGSRRARADFNDSLDEIYDLRFNIFRRKFFIKFINNFLAQLTPFFFYLAGGDFVIVGELSVGALIAVLAANKDLAGPWKELLRYYQRREDVRVKYQQIIEQFTPEELIDVALLNQETDTPVSFTGVMKFRNVGFAESDNNASLKNITVDIKLDEHVRIVGDGGSGKSDLANLIARQYVPSTGSIMINNIVTETLPQASTGRRISYAGRNSYLFSGSIFDNIVYGLQNSENSNDDWNDYQMAGVSDSDSLREKVLDTIDLMGLSVALFRFGMGSRLKSKDDPDIINDLKRARVELRQRLTDSDLQRLVEPFDIDKYNPNMSVAENLLFGNLTDTRYRARNLHSMPLMNEVLAETGLDTEFLRIGFELAELMVELFAEVEPGSEVFDQYSFVGAEELADFQKILNRRSSNKEKFALTEAETSSVRSLPFKLIVSRHRLGLVDEELQSKIVAARSVFALKLKEAGTGYVPFSSGEYQPSISIQENILFGKIVYGQAYAEEKVIAVIDETVRSLGLYRKIVTQGLAYDVGVGGARLGPALRQGVVLCRCLLKRPDMLVVNGGTNALDEEAEDNVVSILREQQKGKSFVFVADSDNENTAFDHTIRLVDGRIQAKVPTAA